MITVVTPTGQIGRALVHRLLDANAPLRLIARYPEKVAEAKARGAEVVVGSLDDPKVLRRALDGARALFWLTPPSYDSEDVVARYAEFGEAAAAAIQATGVPYVVHMSSFGAHLDAATGPIRGNRAVEGALETTKANILHLRPAYFMDNDLWALGSVRAEGAIFLPIAGSRRIPRIATRDVALVAAQRLLELDFEGHHAIELEGPTRVTFDEAAMAIGRVLDKPVRHIQVPNAAAIDALLAIGMTAGAAARVVELYEALDSGLLGGSTPTPTRQSFTTIDAFAREVFLPAYQT